MPEPTPPRSSTSSSASAWSSKASLGLRPGVAWREAFVLSRVAVVAALVPLLVRIDLRRLQRWLEPRRPAVASPADPRSVVEAAGRHVQWVVLRGWPLVRPGCLTRGISGYYLLRRAGLDVALCFGVDSSVDPGRSGHCWLALDGHPILQAVDPRSAYLEVARLSSAGVAGADRR